MVRGMMSLPPRSVFFGGVPAGMVEALGYRRAEGVAPRWLMISPLSRGGYVLTDGQWIGAGAKQFFQRWLQSAGMRQGVLGPVWPLPVSLETRTLLVDLALGQAWAVPFAAGYQMVVRQWDGRRQGGLETRVWEEIPVYWQLDGEVRLARRRRCPLCHGDGWVYFESEGRVAPCAVCQGAGVIVDRGSRGRAGDRTGR